MKLKTLGIWMGFNYKISLKREGITRFVYYLVKHLIKNHRITCELWCYDFNRDEIRVIFSELLGQDAYRDNIKIITENDVQENVPVSRWPVFKASFEKTADILFYGERINWKQPYITYSSCYGIEERELKIRPGKSALKYVFFYGIDVAIAIMLLLAGFIARGIRKIVFNNAYRMDRKPKKEVPILDELAYLANQYSKADVFLIQIVSLYNAVELKGPKVLYLPDLVTLEFYDMFLESYPNAQVWIDRDRATANTLAAQGVFICSNSDYVRRYHALKFIKGVKEEKTDFVLLPANIPDNIMERVSSKQETCEKYLIDCDYIFYPTQIRPYKNILTLLKALEILWAKNVNIKLVSTGYLEHIEQLNTYVKEHNLQKHLIMTGDVPEQDLYALHKYAAATVVPTLFEGGFPWQGLEALLMDTPVIMSKIPVTLERLRWEGLDPDTCGLRLFEPTDEKDLATKISEVLKDRGKAVSDQRSVKDKLFSYNWDDVSKQYYGIFCRLTTGASYIRRLKRYLRG